MPQIGTNGPLDIVGVNYFEHIYPRCPLRKLPNSARCDIGLSDIFRLSENQEIIHEIMGISRKFKSGISLEQAVWALASRRMKVEYDEARDAPFPEMPDLPDTATALEKQQRTWEYSYGLVARLGEPTTYEMERNLQDLLMSGTVEAWGVQLAPEISAEKVHIPSYFFEDRKGIGWHTNSVKKLKREYQVIEIRPPTVATGSQANLAGVDPPPALVAPSKERAAQKRGGGRRSNYAPAKAVLAVLYEEDERFRQMPASQILEAFNERYSVIHAPPGVRVAKVSERALRDYIKRYQQELAETGNN